MDITIYPSKLEGCISAIPSKSMAHRLLICAAFSDASTNLHCPQTNRDIEATAGCLNALGAEIIHMDECYKVRPVRKIPETAELNCYDSGSTLRFMLPLVCALGIETTIHMSGRLPDRPLSPMWEELESHGCKLSRPTATIIHTSGKLLPGEFKIDGNVSSQFITGLLFALSLLNGQSKISVIGELESKPYVEMTQHVLAMFGVPTPNYTVRGCVPFSTPGDIVVEGDWSNGAFFLAAQALGNPLTVLNLDPCSLQGDRVITKILASTEESPSISAADIPDLIPILAVFYATNGGATFTDIARLRLKESDRVVSVIKLLQNLGISVEADTNTMQVHVGQIQGGIVDACGDHRIAMAAGIAATIANSPVTILGAECVEKSYPTFWQEYQRLGGKYEQYIR